VFIGGYLMAGGANAVNMYIDRDIDDRMSRTRLRPIPSGRMRATFEILNWGLDLNHASGVETEKVTAPLLFLTGSEDRINPPSTVARIAALYGARATNEVLQGMGHWLIGEPGWEKLADRALVWLESLP